ncbi:MAG: ATP-binding protein [Spirochaetota bacterium]
MWIEREISKTLKAFAQKRPAILVTGCRQSGKTSLIKHEYPELPYVTLDVPLYAEEATIAGDVFLKKFKRPLIIDEIQYAPQLLRHIKVEIDNNRKNYGQFFIIGSQKFPLMEGVSESLAGRVGIITLHTLSLKEIQNWEGAYNRELLIHYMLLGGYPEIYASGLQLFEFFDDYIVTYIERDVRQMINVKNTHYFNTFIRLLALRSGQLMSLQSLASEVGVSGHTIKSWLSILEISNIIYVLLPYYENLGKRLIKTPKIYFLDTGLLLYLLGIRSQKELLDSPLLGNIFETVCLGQIIRYYTNQGINPHIYFFRDAYGHEIDFVIPSGGKLTLIECKWLFPLDKRKEIISKIKNIIPHEKIKKIVVLSSQNEEAALEDRLFLYGCHDPDRFLSD